MSSSLLIGNKKKDILILGEGFTLGLEHAISAEKMYSINFTKKNTKFCFSLHYNGVNSYLFVNDFVNLFNRLLNLKQKILKVKHIHCV